MCRRGQCAGRRKARGGGGADQEELVGHDLKLVPAGHGLLVGRGKVVGGAHKVHVLVPSRHHAHAAAPPGAPAPPRRFSNTAARIVSCPKQTEEGRVGEGHGELRHEEGGGGHWSETQGGGSIQWLETQGGGAYSGLRHKVGGAYSGLRHKVGGAYSGLIHEGKGIRGEAGGAMLGMRGRRRGASSPRGSSQAHLGVGGGVLGRIRVLSCIHRDRAGSRGIRLGQGAPWSAREGMSLPVGNSRLPL